MKKMIMQFLKDEDGVTMIEYSLLAALIAVAAITILTAIGGDVSTIFETVNSATSTAAAS